MHPAQHFLAPLTILKGSPLKALINGAHVQLIAEAISSVDADFKAKRFMKEATDGLEAHELKGRARHIAKALNQELPTDIKEACRIVCDSFGPELNITENYGLAPFFYMPLSEWISEYATSDSEAGLEACFQITKRYTAEFCIRPFIVEHADETLSRLFKWAEHKNPHVRRLSSEGSRPRLPWAMRLRAHQTDPSRCLPLLEKLKDDSVLYVRRSVANHLGDIAKDHLDSALLTCERWLEESRAMTDQIQAKNRRWIIRHALRYPAKKGHSPTLRLRGEAK